jgi:Ca-activated chloride channel homolog
MKKIILISLLFSCAIVLNAQEFNKDKKLTRILFIMDASISMEEPWEGMRKFDRSRHLMLELLDSLKNIQYQENLQVALRVYGHQSPVPPRDCKDSRLEVGFQYENIDFIKEVLLNISPKGTTPIAYSLEQSATDFPDCDDCRNIIILVTDGLERCQGDPCAISVALQKKGIVLKPYIIGISLETHIADIMDCVGNYYNTANSNEFRQAMNTVVAQITNMTTVQVNLLDTDGNPTETNVMMSFHDNFSNEVRYSYMHTLNKFGEPDTVYLDMLSVYSLKVHTIPPVYVDKIELDDGKHNIIEVAAPQGELLVNITGNNPENKNIKCVIRTSGLLNTVHILDADKKQKLITGLYDLEILTTPRIYKNAVKINQGRVTEISIPEPGDVIINFKNPAFGTLVHEHGRILTNIYDFTPDNQHYRFRLQPGNYRIVYREQQHKSTNNSSETTFRVLEGRTIVHNL